jgi:lipopolysaccharide export system protein LptA
VSGEPGKGMTAAAFRDDVQYREDGGGASGARTARSRALTAELDSGAIASAVFTGMVHFEEKGLRADAAEARYEPRAGRLQLKPGTDGGGPRVADDQITIEADAIDVTLEGRKMSASGNVKTQLRSGDQTPGLLNREQPANISAARLRYQGDVGHATYSGGAQLWQGQTSIRGDEVTIDQRTRNLSATGQARATFAFGAAPSTGRAETIVYDNTRREIALVGKRALAPPAPAGTPPPQKPAPKPPAGAAPSAAAAAAAGAPEPAAQAQLTGPEGDLTADRIVVVLEPEDNRLDRLEAYDAITLRVDTRVVTGDRMTYYRNGRYDMTGSAIVPVRIVESCRETTGRALTFFKSADNIIIDGNEEIRTRTTSGGPCPQPPP